MENTPPGQTTPPTPTPTTLLEAGDLLKTSWERLRRNWKTVVGLEVVSVLPLIVGILLLLPVLPELKEATAALGTENGELNFLQEPSPEPSFRMADLSSDTKTVLGIAAVAFVVSLILQLTAWNGQIFALANENIPLGTAFSHGWKRWFPVLGHGLLLSLIVAPFIILLIAPFIAAALGSFLFLTSGKEAAQVFIFIALGSGILFLVTLPFYIFLMVKLAFVIPLTALGEGSAFSKSWRLSKGMFWAVFGRFILIGIVSAILLMPLQAVFGGADLLSTAAGATGETTVSIVANLVMPIARLAIALYGIAYTVSLLRDLQRIKG